MTDDDFLKLAAIHRVHEVPARLLPFARAIEQTARAMRSIPTGCVVIEEADMVPHVHPQYGSGLFVTEDCVNKMNVGASADHYSAAFYEIAKALGIGARSDSPKSVFENEMLPMIKRLASDAPSQAAQDVLAERQRQVTAEGWTPEHDDEHDSGQLAGAAACYAKHVNERQWVFTDGRPNDYRLEPTPDYWPWDEKWWKPTTPRRDLVKAGALIIAEIERLDRAASDPKGDGND